MGAFLKLPALRVVADLSKDIRKARACIKAIARGTHRGGCGDRRNEARNAAANEQRYGEALVA